MKTRHFFTIITLILMFAAAGMCFAVDTVIRNSSFESVTPEGTPEYWVSAGWLKEESVTKFGIDKKIVHTGKQSVFINNISKNHSYYLQTVPVGENSYYKISGWIKTENIGADMDGASLSLINKFENAGNFKGTSDWQFAELYVVVGSGISSIDVKLQIGNYGAENTGKAWFDDIAIESVQDLPMDAAVVNLTGEEQTSGSSDGGEAVVEEQTPTGLFGSGSFTFILIAVLIIVIVGIIVVILIISMKKKPAPPVDGEEATDNGEIDGDMNSGEGPSDDNDDEDDEDEEP